MIQKYSFNGEDFKAVMQFEGWKIGLLRYSERFSKFDRLERHLLSDEAFILLEGSATLYTDSEKADMKPLTVYNIPAGIWHHIVVSEHASVLVIENRNTSKENTEKKLLQKQSEGGKT